jgi:hypothetical protein
LRFGEISSIDVADRRQELNRGRLAVGQRVANVGERCRVVSLQLLNVRQRRIFPRSVVGHLGCHIGGGALRKDAHRLGIIPLIGGKIGQPVSSGRCALRAKLLKLMVAIRPPPVDLPLTELRFGEHQVCLRGRRTDLQRSARLLFAGRKISGKSADESQIQPLDHALWGTISTACLAASSAFGALRNCGVAIGKVVLTHAIGGVASDELLYC